MLVILGTALPLVGMLVVLAHRLRIQGGPGASPNGDLPLHVCEASRWEGLAMEIAGHAPRPHAHSDAALCRRHLAAVLPADARH